MTRVAGGTSGRGDALTDLASRPDLARLWAAAGRRLEQTGGQLGGVRAVVARPSAGERLAADRLLGVRSRGQALRVPLDRLDATLRERAGTTLCDVVVAACGPLRDRPAERATATEADRRLWADAEAHPAVGRHPQLDVWFARLRITGRWRRLDDPPRRLSEALDVLEHLPAAEPLGRARLAARVLGDSHALDDAAPTGRLVLGALAHLDGGADALAAGERRRLWAGQGITLDETSSSVLTLGLRPLVEGPLTEAAARWADAGVALPLPLAAVATAQWRVNDGTIVWACENATVLEAAAARLGPACPPLVCVEGNPSLAARRLLVGLWEGGAALRYHGDFGTGGLAIGNVVIGELGAEPWRFDAAAHAAALESARAARRPCRPLAGRLPAACWDAALKPAIEGACVEVEEEHVVEQLLDDLRAGVTE